MTTKISVILFDVNETLSDMSPLRDRFVDVGAPASLFEAWFAQTLRDGFALTLAGTPRPFAEVASGVLTQALEPFDLDRDEPDAVQHVIDGFQHLDVHPDVVEGVRSLQNNGFRLVTLTNGSVDISAGLLERAGIRDAFEQTLSVETEGPWKPAPSSYTYALEVCGVSAEQASLVAVHPWDVHGAQRAGLRGVWLNRSSTDYPNAFGTPDVTISELSGLVDALNP